MLSTPSTTLDNRTRLLQATLTCVACHGFHAITTHDIARWAKLGTGTLFRHFPTKAALLHAAFTYALTLLSRQTPPDSPPATLYELVRAQWRQAAQRACDHSAAFAYWRLFRATPLDPTGELTSQVAFSPFSLVLDQVRQVRGRTRFGDFDAWVMVAQWSAAVYFITSCYDCTPGAYHDPDEGPTPAQTLDRAYEAWWTSLGLPRETPAPRRG